MTSLGDDNLTKILHVEKILGYLNNRRVDEAQIDKINDGIFLGDSNINLNSTEYNNRFQVGLSNNNFIIRDLVNEEDRITIDKNTGEITFNPSLPTTNLSNLNDVDISNLSNGNLLFFRETANQFQFTNSIKIKDDDDIEVKDDMFFVNGGDVNIDTTTSNYYVGEELDRLRFIRYDSTDDVVQIGRDAATGCNQTGTIGNVYIGLNAGKFNQQNNNIGIGRDALEFCDCNSVIGIGRQACEGQDVEDQSIGIGRATNQNVSKYGSISIGRFAGRLATGSNSINIGEKAGYSNGFGPGTPIFDNTIILNAQHDTELNAQGSSRFYVKPIRNNSTSQMLNYSSSTGEITYSTLLNELSNLNDVDTTGLLNGNILYYDSSANQFVFNNQTNFSNSTIQVGHLYIDTVNNRLGINVENPDEDLEIDGNIQIDSAGLGKIIFYDKQADHEHGEMDADDDGTNGGKLLFKTKADGGGVATHLEIGNTGIATFSRDMFITECNISIGAYATNLSNGVDENTASNLFNCNKITENSSLINDNRTLIIANCNSNLFNCNYQVNMCNQVDLNTSSNLFTCNLLTSREVRIGELAGEDLQGQESIAIGRLAGSNQQKTDSIAIGYRAGVEEQSNACIAIGRAAGAELQQPFSVAIGYSAADDFQGKYSIAIGSFSANSNQGEHSISLGTLAGGHRQQNDAIAIGHWAASNSQGSNSIALGTNTARYSQGSNSIAIGANNSISNQGSNCISIGNQAGSNLQAEGSIAIGLTAASVNQSSNCIAIGTGAGSNLQGRFSTSIGFLAGCNNQHEYTTIINSTGDVLNSDISGAFYVKPIRNNDTTQILYYNITSGEITYSNNNASGGTGGNYDDITTSNSNSNLFNCNYQVNMCNQIDLNTSSNLFNCNYQVNMCNQIDLNTASNLFNCNKITENSSLLNDNRTLIIANCNSNLYTCNALNDTAVAIGLDARKTNGLNFSVAIGNKAGEIDQNTQGVAIGNQAGFNSQGNNGIALGLNAGRLVQGQYSVALGNNAGSNSQGNASVAIGVNAGCNLQTNNSVAIGNAAGKQVQGQYGIAIGYFAGSNSQNTNAVAIGVNAGKFDQQGGSVAIGNSAGNRDQGQTSVAIGRLAGRYVQGNDAVAIGDEAGISNQGIQSVGIGYLAGSLSQSNYSVAVGAESGRNHQGSNSVSIGYYAGSNSQSANGVAIGYEAGSNNQGGGVAIGWKSACEDQGILSLAIGNRAGSNSQGRQSIAIGALAATDIQGQSALALGYSAGNSNQGEAAVAIGNFAGYTNQSNNSICINATGATFNAYTSNALFIKPVREINQNDNITLSYNSTTGEIYYRETGFISTIINSAQSLNNATFNTLTLNADQNGNTRLFSLLTNTITILEAGFYQMSYNMPHRKLQATASSVRMQVRCAIHKNGTLVGSSSGYSYLRNANSIYDDNCSSCILLECSVNDAITLQYQRTDDQTGALNCVSEEGRFFIMKV